MHRSEGVCISYIIVEMMCGKGIAVMPDQNENLQNRNEREDQRENQRENQRDVGLSPETPEFAPPKGENEEMPEEDFPEMEYPELEFPFMPGGNPEYPWPPIAIYPIPIFPGNISGNLPGNMSGRPNGGGNNRPTYCTIRFLNAAAGYDPVNIAIGNKTVAHHVPYGEVTSYYIETTGFKQIIVTEVKKRRIVLARERFLFNDGDVYTIALVNGMNGMGMVLIPDIPCKNQMQNFACVRAVNLSYNAPAVDVVNRTGRIVFDDLRFKSISAYRQVMEGQQMFLVTDAEDGTEIFDVSEWVEAGKMYTLYIIGDAYVFPGLNGVFTEDYSLLID